MTEPSGCSFNFSNVRSALREDGDAHLVQHGEVAVQGADGDIEFTRQFSRLLVRVALKQHDESDEAGCGSSHEISFLYLLMAGNIILNEVYVNFRHNYMQRFKPD
jgi:hypothetical protein